MHVCSIGAVAGAAVLGHPVAGAAALKLPRLVRDLVHASCQLLRVLIKSPAVMSVSGAGCGCWVAPRHAQVGWTNRRTNRRFAHGSVPLLCVPVLSRSVGRDGSTSGRHLRVGRGGYAIRRFGEPVLYVLVRSVLWER